MTWINQPESSVVGSEITYNEATVTYNDPTIEYDGTAAAPITNQTKNSGVSTNLSKSASGSTTNQTKSSGSSTNQSKSVISGEEDYLLLETGDNLLQEDGFKIILVTGGGAVAWSNQVKST